jgi:hypothetical protein
VTPSSNAAGELRAGSSPSDFSGRVARSEHFLSGSEPALAVSASDG